MSKKILIYKYISIGDLIMSLPGLYLAYDNGYKVYILASYYLREIIDYLDYVDLIELNWFNKFFPFKPGYNVMQNTQNINKYLKIIFKFFGFREYKFNRFDMYNCYYAELLNMAEFLHVEGLNPKNYIEQNREKIYGSLYNKEFEKTIIEKYGKYILLACGAAHNTKGNWNPALKIPPTFIYKNIFEHIENYKEYTAIFIGGAKEQKIGENILNNLTCKQKINLAGKTSLMESITLVKNAFKFITNDTGLAHAASCFDTDTTVIFGPTDSSFFSPQCSKLEIYYKSVCDISPCFPNPKKECLQNMNNLKCYRGE